MNLSPEKYIRTRSRTLPIHECLINADWEETKMGQIIIARKHTNGNFSVGNYLVDLLCLGVKDTFFGFNISEEEYEDLKDHHRNQMEMTVVPYPLVHNIILSGVEFAEEYGFKPCKDYLKTTQFFLEEDTDDIELMEIECGHEDKPLLIEDPEDNGVVKKAYAHLLNTVGADGFYFITELEQEHSDEDHYSYGSNIDEYFYQEPLRERHEDIEFFKQLADKDQKERTDEDAIEFVNVVDRLFYNSFTKEELETQRDFYAQFLSIELNDSELPESLLIGADSTHLERIEDIASALEMGEELKPFKLNKLADQFPEVPFYTLMSIVDMELQQKDPKKILKRIEESLSIYPNHRLLQIMREQYLFINHQTSDFINDEFIKNSSLRGLFGNQSSIHPIEFYIAHTALFEFLVNKGDAFQIETFIQASHQLFPELEEVFDSKIMLAQIQKLNYCIKKYAPEIADRI